MVVHPAIQLLAADYPADAIWRAVLAEDDGALSQIDASAGLLWLLVERTEHGVEVTRLEEGEWRFLSALREGQSFADALERFDCYGNLQDLDPDSPHPDRAANAALSGLPSRGRRDLPAMIAAHIAAGRFAGYREKS